MLLAKALGWQVEVVIPTHRRRGSGFPACYKVDIGNQELRIAIEIDGHSHGALIRKQQDRKKEAFLRSVGWTVLRFSNGEVTTGLPDCVAMVMSTISKSMTYTPTSPMEY